MYDSLKNQVKLNHIKAVHSRSSPLYGEEDGRDVRMIYIYLGSAELISSHRQRVADVDPHSDDNDEKPPDFGQDKTKFP